MKHRTPNTGLKSSGTVEEVAHAGGLYSADFTATYGVDPEEARTHWYPGCAAQIRDIEITTLSNVTDTDGEPVTFVRPDLQAALMAAAEAAVERAWREGEYDGPDEDAYWSVVEDHGTDR